MKVLNEKEAEDFLEKNGLKVAKRKLTANLKEAVSFSKNNYPVVLKVNSSKILHKTDAGGVITDIRNEKDLTEAYKKMSKIPNEGILIQKFIPGNWVLVGIKKDPSFNHVLVFGSGGIYTEILKDVSLRILPSSDKDIKDMVKETKAYSLLTSRNQKTNIKSIEDSLIKIAKLTKKYPNIKELDINPLVVNEKESVIVDARIVLD